MPPGRAAIRFSFSLLRAHDRPLSTKLTVQKLTASLLRLRRCRSQNLSFCYSLFELRSQNIKLDNGGLGCSWNCKRNNSNFYNYIFVHYTFCVQCFALPWWYLFVLEETYSAQRCYETFIFLAPPPCQCAFGPSPPRPLRKVFFWGDQDVQRPFQSVGRLSRPQ